MISTIIGMQRIFYLTPFAIFIHYSNTHTYTEYNNINSLHDNCLERIYIEIPTNLLQVISNIKTIYPFSFYYNEVDEQPDEILMDLIARYGQTIMKARDDLEK